ncbi:MAG: endonuclease III [Methanoregula sp.]|nr:MAG: endonuclease III [Methanoregula sp.]
MQKTTAKKIYSLLVQRYPDASGSPAMHSRGSPFEVLILTILSAQTTDRAVLLVKKPLFIKYPTPAALAQAKIDDVERIIHSLGFFHVKAQYIIAASRTLLSDFHGIVPKTMDELLKIPGVGRKTANIVLYHALGKNDGIAVDTHVRRLAQRIGFSDNSEQDKIEQDLMEVFPREQWGDLTDLLIAHGRACCNAKKPRCNVCPVKRYCLYARAQKT